MGYKQGAKHTDVMHYHPPQGPTTLMHEGPGLGGVNCGHCGTQGPERCPTDLEVGSPGLHGTNKGMGTNRRG